MVPNKITKKKVKGWLGRMKTLNIDVMILGGAKHYCTLTYRYNPLFKLSPADIGRFVYEKRPTLKYRNDVRIIVNNN